MEEEQDYGVDLTGTGGALLLVAILLIIATAICLATVFKAETFGVVALYGIVFRLALL